MQETWLDESIPSVKIPGYSIVSRRDRQNTANRGGILTLQRDDFNCLVHIGNSSTEERSWHFLRVDTETYLVANWYRSGSVIHDGFHLLHNEIRIHFEEISGIILAGDLNVHHKKWLKFSNTNTQIGTDLKNMCDYFGMWQAVKEPTRNQYLLDLVLSNVHGLSAEVLPYIADHKGVLCKLPCREILEKDVEREVWQLNKADWDGLKEALNQFDWHALQNGTAEDALAFFYEVLWNHLIKFIPRCSIKEKKSSHPWLNQRSIDAIKRKNDAENTDRFQVETDKCTQVLMEERGRYITTLKEKLVSLPKGSKRWWQINRELLNRKGKLSSIPLLKKENNWIIEIKIRQMHSRKFLLIKPSFPRKQSTVLFLVFLTKNSKDEFVFVHVLVNDSLIN